MNYYQFQKDLLQGKISSEQLIQTFEELETRPLTKNQFLEIYKASQESQIQIKTNFDIVDFVGTGGDIFDTFNISTISALMFADFSQNKNLLVAKHGNRSATSSVGSADLLEKLGVSFDASEFEINQSLQEKQFSFVFAPIFNPGFRFAKIARNTFAKKTYFNLLGPLLNPTNPKFMIIGLYDLSLVNYYLEVLPSTTVEKAWIVRGRSGINEIDPTGITEVVEYSKNGIKNFELSPSDFGIKAINRKNLATGNLEYNTNLAKSILGCECTDWDKVNAVLVNIASMLVITGQFNLKTAMQICQNNYQNHKSKSAELQI